MSGNLCLREPRTKSIFSIKLGIISPRCLLLAPYFAPVFQKSFKPFCIPKKSLSSNRVCLVDFPGRDLFHDSLCVGRGGGGGGGDGALFLRGGEGDRLLLIAGRANEVLFSGTG